MLGYLEWPLWLAPLVLLGIMLEMRFRYGLTPPGRVPSAIGGTLGRLLRWMGASTPRLVGGVFLTAVALRLGMLSVIPVQPPGIHDEFGYLLQAETFVQGRLTNPTHPMWVHFETFHINHIPTYTAKFPPGQGLMLGLGILLGHAWIGVLLSSAAMCALLAWAIASAVPGRWAAFGGLLLAALFCVGHYWSSSYWGGSVAGCGGALVLGASIRFRAGPTGGGPAVVYGMLAGTGLGILALTRPFEGAALGLLLLLWTAWGMRSKQQPHAGTPWWNRPWLAALGGCAAMLLLFGGFFLIYNHATTGHALTMAYSEHHRQYARRLGFAWEEANASKTWRHEVMAQYYGGYAKKMEDEAGGLQRLLKTQWKKVLQLPGFFLWPGVLLALPGVLAMCHRRRDVGWLLLLGASSLAFLPFGTFWPHYAAPLMGLYALILVQGLRRTQHLRWHGMPVGRRLVTLALPLMVLGGIAATMQWRDQLFESDLPQRRAAVVAALKAQPGKDLVLVRYSANHNIHDEWVFNGPDLDAAPILFARDMGDADNRALLTYYADRVIWRLTPDVRPFELSEVLTPLRPGQAVESP